jgi:transcriptional regulator with XRE-family HTH domain
MIKDAIRHFRRQKKLTQEELAKQLGVSIDTIRRWESGLRAPRVTEISKLAEALGVTETELLKGPEKRRLEIIIDLEGSDETMEAEAIKSESAFVGYRGSDDSLIFRGAIPVGGAPKETVIEATLNAIREHLEAAYASRDVLRKLLG